MIKDVDLLTADDIRGLVTGAVGEKLTIEYKEQLPTWGDGTKKEFLADVSSFANSAGGQIFYGIRDLRENGQPTGIPEAAPGLVGVNADEIGRIEQIIRTGISPRLNGVKVRSFPGFDNGPVIVVQVPKSWSPPHAVWFQETSKFWARGNHGKYQLNVEQVGSAFLGSDTAAKRIRDFRFERIAAIGAGESPVQLRAGRRLTIHLVPLSTLGSREAWPVSRLEEVAAQTLKPFSCSQGWSDRINLDGFLRHSGLGAHLDRWSYVQLYRNGTIEACDTLLLGGDAAIPIPSLALEQGLISGLTRFLQVQRELGVEFPIALMLTLEGIRGTRLAVTNNPFGQMRDTIDRDKLFLPDVLIEDSQLNAGRILRPVFDAIYNASSFKSCQRYNAAGEYDASLMG